MPEEASWDSWSSTDDAIGVCAPMSVIALLVVFVSVKYTAT